MLLDTQAVKTILLDIPSLGKQVIFFICSINFCYYCFYLIRNCYEQTSGAASYSKFVSREMSKAEALLKVCVMFSLSIKI